MLWPTLVRRLGALLAIGGAAAILAATLSPNPQQATASAATPLLCILCGEGGGTDVFLNLLLFAPMAAGLRLAGWPWRRVVAGSALLSLGVEYLQFAVVPGRDSSLSDLLTNTSGAALAAAIAPYLPGVVAPGPALARRLLACALAFQLGVMILSAIGFMPSVPSGPIRSECTSYTAALGAWTGRLESVALNGVTLPCDERVRDSAAVRGALLADATRLRLAGVSGAPDGRMMVHAIRAGSEAVLAVIQDGRAVAFNVPTVSRRLRLSPVTLHFAGGLPAEPGTPLVLQAGREGPRLWMTSSYSGQRRSTEVKLSPFLGWTSLLWWGLEPGSRLRVLTAIWLGALVLPVGYWAGFTRQPVRGIGAVAAALVAGLWLIPLVTGYPPAGWSEWLGGVLGATLGGALYRLAAYLQSRCGSPSTSAYSSS